VINLKKVVVVIGGGRTVTFEGDKLKVSNNSEGYLLIRDMGKESNTEIGVFKSWRYWKEVDEQGSNKKETEITYGDSDKLKLINRDGTCVASLYILPDGNLKVDSWLLSKDELKTRQERISEASPV